MIESGLLEIYFTDSFYKESVKSVDLVTGRSSYEEDKILWNSLKDKNRSSIGIFVDGKGELQINLDDLKYSLELDFIDESNLAVSSYQCHFHNIDNSRRENFINKDNLFKLFLYDKRVQSKSKDLKNWLDAVYLFLDSKEIEEITIFLSKRDSKQLKEVLKGLKDSSVEDLISRIVRDYLSKFYL